MALVSLKAPRAAALWIMVVLLFVVTLLDSPFRSALMPDILSEDAYVIGPAVTQTAIQVGMVSGFALGRTGGRVPGPRVSVLVVDAIRGDRARRTPRPGVRHGKRRHAGVTRLVVRCSGGSCAFTPAVVIAVSGSA